jgi:Ribbon-helix-helix protein, copG family
MGQRINVHLPPELLQQVADLAACKKLSRSAIMEAAVTSFLSPDGADRREAAFTRRLDRLTRQVQRLERNTGVTMEMLGCSRAFSSASLRNCHLTSRHRRRQKGVSGMRGWSKPWDSDSRRGRVF